MKLYLLKLSKLENSDRSKQLLESDQKISAYKGMKIF